MSFREKSVWISFVSILIVFGYYFTTVARAMLGLRSESNLFAVLVVAIAALVVLEVVLHIIVAIQSPSEARSPRDERERLIAFKATQIGFYVLIIGALAGIFTMHLGAGRRDVGNAVLLAIVIAQLTKYGAEIVYFRRGA
jgi:hypothetical protein